MRATIKALVTLLLVAYAGMAVAKIVVDIHTTVEPKRLLGSITLENTVFGLLITPDLKDLPPGVHGLHIHENGSCGHQGKDAGPHFDPKKTKKHLGPYSRDGHLGDLPVLFVDSKGNASTPTLAPRPREQALKNRAIIIHAGGDNYSDTPQSMGGGGPRIGCGMIGVDKK